MIDDESSWTRESLLNILSSGTLDERLDRLRRMGVIDKNNNLVSKPHKWGKNFLNIKTIIQDIEDDAQT
jgi:hypothetical protein